MTQLQKARQRLVKLLTETNLSYNEKEKAEFHKLGKQTLRALAYLLSLPAGSYEVRSNLGGIAVSGEVTLHSEQLYVQFSQGGSGLHVIFRTCQGRKDYVGGTNYWLKATNLLDLPGAARVMLAILPRPAAVGNT